MPDPSSVAGLAGLYTKKRYDGQAVIDPIDIGLLFAPGPGEARIATKIVLEFARQYALMLHDISRDLGPSRHITASTAPVPTTPGHYPGETISRAG